MSTREERRQDRRRAEAVAKHWLAGAEDAENRIYAAVRMSELPHGAQVPSATRPCLKCKELVAVDIRLTTVADRAKAILCTVCIEKVEGKPWEAILMDNLNRDNGEEI
jgi:hypothetical protein